jgi:hypothetical protein
MQQFFIKTSLFLQNNKKQILAFSALMLLIIFVFFGYNQYQLNLEQKYSKLLHEAIILQDSNKVDAKKAIEEIYKNQQTPANIKQLAGLRYAADLVETNPNEAIIIYQNLLKCSNCDQYLKELPMFLLAKTFLLSTDSKIDIANEIKKLEEQSKIFRHYIAEQRGIFFFSQKNFDEAYKIFDFIAKSPESEEMLKNRAKVILSTIVSEGYQPKSS